MESVSGFLTLMAAVSLAVERTTEIIKGFVPFLNQPSKDPTIEGIRGALVRLIAALCGGCAAYAAQSQIKASAFLLSSGSIGWWSYALIGLMACSGSAFWNHLLDILQNLKNVKPQAAPAPRPVSISTTAGR